MAEPEGGEKRTLQQSLRETWMGALGVLSGAEGAAHRLLESVGAEAKAAELLARVKRNRELIEQRIDDGVKQAVARVRQPFVQRIADMRGRVERLQHAVDEFARKRRRGGK
jgi:hypothetical protein